MNPLIRDYFQRDLSPAEEERLHNLLLSSEKDALDFSREAEQRYAALGLAAAGVLLAKGAAGAGNGGWLAKLWWGLKAMTLKTAATAVAVTVMATAAMVAAVKMAPRLGPRPAPAPAAIPGPAVVPAPSAKPSASAKAKAEGDSLAITLELAAPRVLTVTVFDAAGRAVRHFSSQRYEAGIQRVLWDGRDDAGRPVAGGRYRVSVDLGGKSMERWFEVQ